MNNPNLPQSLLLLTALSLSPLSAQTVIFTEDFSGDDLTELNESTPDTTNGPAWVSSSNFKTDGSFGGSAGSATLAFSPIDGLIYQLDASVSVSGVNANWFALGYVSGQSTNTGNNNRFVTGNVTLGRAWMLIRGDNSIHPNAAHTETTGDPVTWAGTLANADGGDLDLRIILDTRDGTDAWKTTWFAKRPADADYTEVRNETILLNQEINAIGFAVGNTDVFGAIKSLSLTSNAQPISSAPKIIALARNLEGDIVLTLDRPAEGFQAQHSDDLNNFEDVASISDGNTLTITADDVDSNNNGVEFYRVRE